MIRLLVQAPMFKLQNSSSGAMEALNEMSTKYQNWYSQQSTAKKALLVAGGILCIIISILVVIYHLLFLELLVTMSDAWVDLKFGKLILWLLVFFVGFPPLLGFTPLAMLCGMTYGFPWGWPILASASVLGSLASFLVFRHLLHNQAERMVHLSEQFRAFSEILKEDASLFVLVLLRLCPLPYSLSNGALAAIPELPTLTYFLASLITSPKLLIHVFVGHTMKTLGDANRPTSAKIIDVVSVIITGSALLLASYIIYVKMQKKVRSYHQNPQSDEMIFGNFDDDLESGQNLELASNDYDDDNFIITEDDDFAEESESPSQNIASRDSLAKLDHDLDSQDLEATPKRYRDY